MSHKVIVELILNAPMGAVVEVPRMATLDRHSIFANVRHCLRSQGWRLSVKTDGAFHYVRKLPILDNKSPDSL